MNTAVVPCRFCGSTLTLGTLRATVHTRPDAVGRVRYTLAWVDRDLLDPEAARSVGRRCAHRAQVFFTRLPGTLKRLAPSLGPQTIVESAISG